MRQPTSRNATVCSLEQAVAFLFYTHEVHMDFANVVAELVAGLVGFPALVAALINAAKWKGWLKDGQAANVNMLAHLVAYIGVGIAVITGRVDILEGLDLQLGNVANSLLILLAFLSSLGIAKKFHYEVLYGLHIVGYVHPLAVNELDEQN